MTDDVRRRSLWMLRALEWNDPKARYPNLWSNGLPSTMLVFDTIARRLRIGDLVAVYHPASTKHADRSERFVGLVRVAALRRSDTTARYWLDLDPAHRFRRPLDLGGAPRRVFLCCDPGWPEPDVELFHKVAQAAIGEGWTPLSDEPVEGGATEAPAEQGAIAEPDAPVAAPTVAVPGSVPGAPKSDAPDRVVTGDAPEETHVGSHPIRASDDADVRLFAGVSWTGDRRDPRERTWLALVRLEQPGPSLRVVRLEATGRHGAQGYLRDPDRELMRAEAIGCAFPFGHPVEFVEHVFSGPFPGEGWWGMARGLERVGYPDFLVKLQEFRDANGEPLRYTDERAGAPSPLSRDAGDRASMSFHGIRMIAEDRSRFAVRPFENAQGRLLVEVDPVASSRDLRTPRTPDCRPRDIAEALATASDLAVRIEPPHRSRCHGSVEALDAVLAARSAARAVLRGETEKTPEELAPDAPERIRREGWIYGLTG